MSEPQPLARSLAGIARIVAAATLLSKVAGLVREQVNAAVFGVGAAYGAYQYAGIIPSFFLVLLGGINGPFHSALVSVLAKRTDEEAAPLVETISTLVGSILLVVTLAVIVGAPVLIDLIAPGLQKTAQDSQVRALAIQQLRLMAPIVWFGGMIGIGFGTLTAANQYWLPSISPLISSTATIAGVSLFALFFNGQGDSSQYALTGGVVLAGATLAGTILQWLAQVWVQGKAGLGKLRLRFEVHQPGVQQVLGVMGPAFFASGMLQINVYTDMFFTSFLLDPAGAVAALNFANLLVQAPLGILSSMILVPLLPTFSRLTEPQDWPALKQRIRQGLLVSAIVMLPLAALTMALALPIVQVVYERGAFDPSASRFVATILGAYAVGMFVYLGRDVLVRVFYALGDGTTPFRLSLVNIGFNALFDLLLYKPLGAAGLVLATVAVNIVSMLILLKLLDQKINGLPWREWSVPLLGLTLGSFVAGIASWGTLTGLQQLLGPGGLWVNGLQLIGSALIGLVVYTWIAVQMKLPEVHWVSHRIRQRLSL